MERTGETDEGMGLALGQVYVHTTQTQTQIFESNHGSTIVRPENSRYGSLRWDVSGSLEIMVGHIRNQYLWRVLWLEVSSGLGSRVVRLFILLLFLSERGGSCLYLDEGSWVLRLGGLMWLGNDISFLCDLLTLGIGGWAEGADVRLTVRGPRGRTS